MEKTNKHEETRKTNSNHHCKEDSSHDRQHNDHEDNTCNRRRKYKPEVTCDFDASPTLLYIIQCQNSMTEELFPLDSRQTKRVMTTMAEDERITDLLLLKESATQPPPPSFFLQMMCKHIYPFHSPIKNKLHQLDSRSLILSFLSYFSAIDSLWMTFFLCLKSFYGRCLFNFWIPSDSKVIPFRIFYLDFNTRPTGFFYLCSFRFESSKREVKTRSGKTWSKPAVCSQLFIIADPLTTWGHIGHRCCWKL